uniref:Uncharacterized protein n=1 Tax=Oryza punctata TaxID=4537 RepID=A0A0E0LLG8_ORYPU
MHQKAAVAPRAARRRPRRALPRGAPAAPAGRPRVVAAAVGTRFTAFSVLPPEQNLTLAVDATVHNPGHAPLRYGEVVTASRRRGRSRRGEGRHGQAPRDVITAGALPFETATAVAGEAAAAALPRPFKVGDGGLQCHRVTVQAGEQLALHHYMFFPSSTFLTSRKVLWKMESSIPAT